MWVEYLAVKRVEKMAALRAVSMACLLAAMTADERVETTVEMTDAKSVVQMVVTMDEMLAASWVGE